jgi:sugar phosphate isomerase/epimerase
MKLVYHTIVAGGNEPLAELIPIIAEAGLPAIEAHSGTIRWFEPDLEEQLEAISGALARSDLELHSVHAPCGDDLDWSSSDEEVCGLAQGMMGSVIEWSAELGARVLVLHPGRVGERETDAAYVQRLANNIAPLVVTAETEWITLALENQPQPHEHTEAMAQVVRLAASDSLVVCLDTGHAHMIEGLATALEVGGDLIGHIHVHDNDGQNDQHLLPGQGTINWKDFMPFIGPESEFQGAVVLEARRPEGVSLAALHKKMCEFLLA